METQTTTTKTTVTTEQSPHAYVAPGQAYATATPVYTNPHCGDNEVVILCEDHETKGLLDDDDETIENYIANQCEEDRGAFVKKVMGLLSCMLLFTFLTVVGGTLLADWDTALDGTWKHGGLRDWSGGYGWHLTITFFCCAEVTIVIPIMMACCDIGRYHPTNYVMLSIYTLCTSFMFGWLSMFYTATSMYLAFGTGCAIAFGLMGYAMYTKSDFTGCGPYLFVIVLGVLVCGVSSGLMYVYLPQHMHPPWYGYPLNGVMIIICCLYIVYYMQLVVGGEHHRYQFSIDDYAFAALVLYAEIVELIFRILAATGDAR